MNKRFNGLQVNDQSFAEKQTSVLNSVKEVNSSIKKISFFTYGMIGAFVVLIIFSLSKKILTDISYAEYLSAIGLLVGIVYTLVNLHNSKKHISELPNLITDNLCDQCHGHRLFAKFGETSTLKYTDAKNFIRDQINNEKNYEKLLSDLEKEEEKVKDAKKQKELKNINYIVNQAKKSKCGRFLCVVTNLFYLKEEHERSMLEYFLNYYLATRSNYVVRIFNIPFMKNDDKIVCSELLTQEERIRLLKFIICNQIVGIRTQLLLLDPIVNKDLAHIDYVLASPIGQEEVSKKLFFSYTKTGNNTITSKDALLTQIFEDDFEMRLTMIEDNPAYSFSMVEIFDKFQINRLLNMFELTIQDYNKCIDSLYDFVKNETIFKFEKLDSDFKKYSILKLESLKIK